MYCGIAHLQEKITAIGYPWFYKTTPFLSFEGKKQGQTHLFFLVKPIIWDASKTAKNQWNCIVLNFEASQTMGYTGKSR